MNIFLEIILGAVWFASLKVMPEFFRYFYLSYVFEKVISSKKKLNFIGLFLYWTTFIGLFFAFFDLTLVNIYNIISSGSAEYLLKAFWVINVFSIVFYLFEEKIQRLFGGYKSRINKGNWSIKNLLFEIMTIYSKLNYLRSSVVLFILSLLIIFRFFTTNQLFWDYILIFS